MGDTTIKGFRARFNSAFDKFRDNHFKKLVQKAVAWRYTTISVAVAALFICIGLVLGGEKVSSTFPARRLIILPVQMDAGTPRAQTIRMVHEMERSLRRQNRL